MIVERPETEETETLILQPVLPAGIPVTLGAQNQTSFEPQERDTTVTVQWIEAIGVNEDNLYVDLAALGILGLMSCTIVFTMLRLKDIQ